MFDKGQYVVKANTGVCRVIEIVSYSAEEEDEEKLYYNLELLSDKRGTILVPVDSRMSSIRPVMSEREASGLLKSIRAIETVFEASDRLREQGYKDAIKSNDPLAIAGMIKGLYKRENERLSQGKRVTAVDERYSHMAESALFPELALVLGKEPEEIKRLIIETLDF